MSSLNKNKRFWKNTKTQMKKEIRERESSKKPIQYTDEEVLEYRNIDLTGGDEVTKRLFEKMGINPIVQRYVVEKQRVPILDDSTVKIKYNEIFKEPQISKRKRLFEFLHKKEMGYFDEEPANENLKKIRDLDLKDMEKLLADPTVIIDNVDIATVNGKYTIKNAGFPDYYKRKPPLEEKNKDNNFKQPKYVEYSNPRDTHSLQASIPDGLRKVTVLKLKEAVFELFGILDRIDLEREEKEKQVGISNGEIDEDSGNYKPYIEDLDTFKTKKFKQFCDMMNRNQVESPSDQGTLWEKFENLMFYKESETESPSAEVIVENQVDEDIVDNNEVDENQVDEDIVDNKEVDENQDDEENDDKSNFKKAYKKAKFYLINERVGGTYISSLKTLVASYCKKEYTELSDAMSNFYSLNGIAKALEIDYYSRDTIEDMNDLDEIKDEILKVCSRINRAINTLMKVDTTEDQRHLPKYVEGGEEDHFKSSYKSVKKYLKRNDIYQINTLVSYYCTELTADQIKRIQEKVQRGQKVPNERNKNKYDTESSKKTQDIIALSKLYGLNGIAKALGLTYQEKDDIEEYDDIGEMRKAFRGLCSLINDKITKMLRTEKPSPLVQFEKEKINIMPYEKSKIPTRDILSEQTEIIFEKFQETHPTFYSVYSFVPIEGVPNTGIYDILKNQKNKTVIDVYILREIQRKTDRFGPIPEPTNIDDLYDQDYLKDLKRKTNNYLKTIIKSYLERDLVGNVNVIKTYLTQKQANDCNVYEAQWKDVKEEEVEQEWNEMKTKYDAELKAWEDKQNDLERIKDGDVEPIVKELVNENKENLSNQVEEFENAVYEIVKESTTNHYLMILCQFLMAFDRDHDIGKHANVFRAKVISGMYRINQLQNASQAHLFPEFYMNDKIIGPKLEEFQRYYTDKLYDIVQEVVVSYLYTINVTMQRLPTNKSQNLLNFSKYAVKPQEVCVNQPEALSVADGDLVICKKNGKFYCYSRQQLEKLLMVDAEGNYFPSNPIDPYTGEKFPSEMMDRFKRQFGWNSSSE